MIRSFFLRFQTILKRFKFYDDKNILILFGKFEDFSRYLEVD